MPEEESKRQLQEPEAASPELWKGHVDLEEEPDLGVFQNVSQRIHDNGKSERPSLSAGDLILIENSSGEEMER